MYHTRLEKSQLKKKGDDLFEEKKYGAAIDIYRTAISLPLIEKIDQKIFLKMTKCFQELKEYEESICHIYLALLLDIKSVEAQILLVKAFIGLKQYHVAFEYNVDLMNKYGITNYLEIFKQIHNIYQKPLIIKNYNPKILRNHSDALKVRNAIYFKSYKILYFKI